MKKKWGFDFTKMLDDLSHDGNSLNTAELDIIREVIDTYRVATYLEIGTYRGYSSFGVYDLVVQKYKGHIISVDILDGTAGWDAEEHISCHAKNEEFKRKNDLHNITFLTMGSDAFFQANQEKYECIMIDGEHSYDQVKCDLANSLDTVTENGLIILHDFNKSEIKKCVGEIDSSLYATETIRGVERLLILRVNQIQSEGSK